MWILRSKVAQRQRFRQMCVYILQQFEKLHIGASDRFFHTLLLYLVLLSSFFIQMCPNSH